ncbi:MAG: HDIG domain-containing protein [Bacilli bacterium]|nr:HDIG domain-containing protein [Bacilli bacterium]
MKNNIDLEYVSIIENILDNKEYQKLKQIEHHGITRYDHCLKVSFYSYKVAHALRLDYESVARAGLLHDFFLSDNERTFKDRFVSVFVHPKFAVEKSSKEFNISDKEKDIIRTHMFPINPAIPKYAESWIVSIVDKFVALNEFSHKFSYKLKYALNLYIIFLINFYK